MSLRMMFVLALWLIMAAGRGAAAAVADSNGVQTFSANISSNACTITGLDVLHNWGDMPKSLLLSTSDGGILKSYSDVITVSNCPDSATAVSVTFLYKAVPGLAFFGDVENEGAARGIMARLSQPGSFALPYGEGQSVDFPLVKGGVDITVNIDLLRMYRDTIPDAAVTSGTGKFDATMVLSVS